MSVSSVRNPWLNKRKQHQKKKKEKRTPNVGTLVRPLGDEGVDLPGHVLCQPEEVCQVWVRWWVSGSRSTDSWIGMINHQVREAGAHHEPSPSRNGFQ